MQKIYENLPGTDHELLRVRSEVFVVEQNCVYQDLDGDDQQSLHLWLTVGEKVVASSSHPRPSYLTPFKHQNDLDERI